MIADTLETADVEVVEIAPAQATRALSRIEQIEAEVVAARAALAAVNADLTEAHNLREILRNRAAATDDITDAGAVMSQVAALDARIVMLGNRRPDAERRLADARRKLDENEGHAVEIVASFRPALSNQEAAEQRLKDARHGLMLAERNLSQTAAALDSIAATAVSFASLDRIEAIARRRLGASDLPGRFSRYSAIVEAIRRHAGLADIEIVTGDTTA